LPEEAVAHSDVEELIEEAARSHLRIETEGVAETSGLEISWGRVRDYGLKPITLLFVLNAVDEFDRSVLAVAMETIREEFAVSDAVVGLLPFAFVLLAGVIGVPAGTWADRWVRKYIITIGAMVWGAAGLLAAVVKSFAQLFATRVLLGAGQGTIGPTHLSLLSDYYPINVRGRVLGYHRAANPAGQVLGAILGGVIVAGFGWRWAFVAAAIPGIAFGLYALTLREPNRGESDINQVSKQNPLIAAFLKEPEDKKGFFESLSTIFKRRTLRYLIAANATVGFALVGILFWLPALFERRYGYSARGASAVLGALGIASFLGTWLGSPRSDKELRKGFRHLTRFGATGVLVLAVLWPLAFVVTNPVLVTVLLSVGAFVASYGLPGLIAVVAATSPPRVRSQSFAVFGLALAVCGAAVAPILIGGLSDLLQTRGFDYAEALRWSLFVNTVAVVGFGTWCIYRAAGHAAQDVTDTISEFLAEMVSADTNKKVPSSNI
jgi:sugar phosphate permease